MNLSPQHVCFDKDGTLIDVHASWVPITQRRAKKIIQAYRLPESAFDDSCRVMGVDPQAHKILPGGPVGYKPRATIIVAVEQWLKDLNVVATTDELAEIFRGVDEDIQRLNDFNVAALPGVVDGIKRLKRSGLKISIYTSDRQKNTQHVLALLGLSECIDAIVGGDDVCLPKPDPEGFLKACVLVGIDGSRSIYVGDTVDDMLMAQRGGFLGGYGITHGLASRAQLAAESQKVFDTFSGLVDSLLEQANDKKTIPSI